MLLVTRGVTGTPRMTVEYSELRMENDLRRVERYFDERFVSCYDHHNLPSAPKATPAHLKVAIFKT